MSNIKDFLTNREQVQFIAVHNTSEEKLEQLFDMELEGIPAPSIQIKTFPSKFTELDSITKDDSLHTYGEISFIFDHENIFGSHRTIPERDKTHQIFTGDAYTIRNPDPVYSIDKKELKTLFKSLMEINDSDKSFANDFILDRLSNYSKYHDKTKDDLKKSSLMKLLFLKEHGLLEQFKVVRTRRKLDDIVKKNSKIKKILSNYSYDYFKDNEKLIIQAFKDAIEKEQDHEQKEVLTELYYLDGAINIDDIYSIHKSDIEILRGKTTKVNKETTYKNLNTLIKKAERNSNNTLRTFIKDAFMSLYINPRIQDNNQPYTLDNTLKWMRKNGGAGTEQSLSLNYHAVGATNQSKIRTVEDLEFHLDKIVTNAERQEYTSKIREFEMKLEYNMITNHYHGESSRHEEKQEEFVKSIGAMGSYPSIDTVKKCLNRYGFIMEDQEVLKDIQEFAKLNNNVLHEYYEAKPKKAFYFNQRHSISDEKIRGVVVPNDLCPKLLKKLEKHKIKIVKYNPNNPEARMRALYKFRDCFIKQEQEKPTPKKNIKQSIKS